MISELMNIKTYKITFIKDPEITIDSIVNGVTYYASKVEPGGTYRFKVSSSDFTGIDKKSIIVKKVGGMKRFRWVRTVLIP